MRLLVAGVALLLLGTPVLAQRPSDPALLVPQQAPPLDDYAVAPNAVTLPAGVSMGATASVAFDARGHLYVLTRGDEAFFEFDPKGAFVRSIFTWWPAETDWVQRSTIASGAPLQ